jgi:hypothetical protein
MIDCRLISLSGSERSTDASTIFFHSAGTGAVCAQG